MYRQVHKNGKTKGILIVITLISLLTGEVWFMGIFMSVNPYSMPLLDMSKNQKIISPKDATYQINIVNNIIVLHEAKDVNSQVLDITGPFVPTVVGMISLILVLRKQYVDYKNNNSKLDDEKIRQENEKQMLHDVLKMRYAKGEITKDELDNALKDLGL